VTPRLDEPWRLPGLEVSVAAAPLETDWLWSRVVAPLPAIAICVQGGGLQIADIDHADSGLFKKAAEVIAWVPSLAAIVATRVAVVHLLRANPGYDVSHSEPRWRDRIFVSVPARHDEVGALRLAEGIIHEALHLHLTELEEISPLVRDLTGTLASPWRPEPRSYGGVLHGAFVFVGLRAYFDIVTAPSGSCASHHLDKRRAEIAMELAEVDLVALKAGLTASGDALLSRLFAEAAKVGDG
jgi:HEXXH motif-containing protein